MVMVLIVLVVVPEGTALYLVESGRVEKLQSFLSIHLAISLGMLVPLSRMCSYMIVGREISSLFDFCQTIKKGQYNVAFSLPNEKEEETEIIKLKRLLNWMAHSLYVRESTRQHQFGKNEKLKKHFQNLSMKDELTQLFNRRYFNARLGEEIVAARKTGAGLCLMLIDIDNFKQVNDTFGHQEGDDLLKTLATIILGSIRCGADIPFRYGGDEFGVILPEINAAEGRAIAERIRESYVRAAPAMTSLSIGVASLHLSFIDLDDVSDEFIKAADDAVYIAKKNGRNSVIVAGEQYAFPQTS
jgi:diguanylate cyclase (GGDEF)-like protein